MNRKDKLKKEIRFLKHAVVKGKNRYRVRYSKGSYTKQSGLPEGTITIYAKDFGNLPKELKPINETDSMTDYFEKDRARIKPKSKYYKKIEKLLMGK